MPLPRALRVLLAMCLAVALGLVAVPASAAPSSLDADVQVGNNSVTVRGTLQDNRGRGIRNGAIIVYVDGNAVGETSTRGNGGFRVDIARDDLSAGEHELVVAFPGRGNNDAAQVSMTVRVEAGNTPPGQQPRPTATPTVTQPPADPTPAPTPTPTQTADPEPTDEPEPEPTPEPLASSLTATGPAGASNGDSVTLSGTLVNGAGTGIQGVGIDVLDRSGAVPGSFAVTEADGTFSTTYRIPAIEPTGTLTLTLEFDGAGTYAPSTATVTIPVTYVPPPTPTATPSGSASATATASPTAIETDAVDGGTTATVDDGENPWLIPLIVLLVLGGAAIITAAALLLRGGMQRRPAHTDAGGLDFIDEEMEGEEDSFFGDEETAYLAGDEPTRVIDEGDATEVYDAGFLPPDDTPRRSSD